MTNIVEKLLTAIRGGARELGEAVVDTQSMRIFEQEIRDSKNGVAEAKEGLTEIVARKMAVDRKLNQLKEDISENESYALKALEKKDEALALEIADKVAKLEIENNELKQEALTYEQQITLLKSEIKRADKTIAEHERELLMVKTRESVQQATQSVTQSVTMNQSSIGTARESLERIKQKQQKEQDKFDAGVQLQKEMQDDSLDEKLKTAGIIKEKHTAADVLQRLKNSTYQ